MSFDLNSGKSPTLIPNPHSWTKVSSIIFLDSPVGTGFSYSNTSTDYMTGDFKAVSDIHTFVIKWFEAFPEFLSNPFYVGGDSYSGLIAPLVVNGIAKAFQGYLLGNGLTDEAFDHSQVPFAHGKGLISDELYQEEITGEWERCTHRFKYDYQVHSVIEYHHNLTRKGYRALIYSGDQDMVIPFVGTEAWIRSLNYTILDDWRPWWVDRQVAGYTRLYENNLMFATVKGGGHTAPEYKPPQAFVMFKKWMSREHL
eukprot:PITA_08356